MKKKDELLLRFTLGRGSSPALYFLMRSSASLLVHRPPSWTPFSSTEKPGLTKKNSALHVLEWAVGSPSSAFSNWVFASEGNVHLTGSTDPPSSCEAFAFPGSLGSTVYVLASKSSDGSYSTIHQPLVTGCFHCLSGKDRRHWQSVAEH